MSLDRNNMIRDRNNFTVSYSPNMVVLRGANRAIHNEADKILHLFAFSAYPYKVKCDTAVKVVLVPRDNYTVL